MSEEFLPHLFEEFTRERSSTETKLNGTGLGMPIVKKLVDLMEKAEAGYYDLILMDIQMPNMDGYKATHTIRKLSDPRKAGITIVAMTANAFDEDRANAYKAGMNWHIAKPIKVDELMSALTEILKEQKGSGF